MGDGTLSKGWVFPTNHPPVYPTRRNISSGDRRKYTRTRDLNILTPDLLIQTALPDRTVTFPSIQ